MVSAQQKRRGSDRGPRRRPVPDTMLEEIVITAEKRPEKLQDVPVSASWVSTSALRGAQCQRYLGHQTI